MSTITIPYAVMFDLYDSTHYFDDSEPWNNLDWSMVGDCIHDGINTVKEIIQTQFPNVQIHLPNIDIESDSERTYSGELTIPCEYNKEEVIKAVDSTFSDWHDTIEWEIEYVKPTHGIKYSYTDDFVPNASFWLHIKLYVEQAGVDDTAAIIKTEKSA